jgi:hypothetical protein
MTNQPVEVTLLAAQLDTSMEFFTARLAGLTDEEYLWEPVPGAWNLRPRGSQRTANSAGAGGWVWEYESPTPEPPPLRTIAWLMWHIAAACQVRADWTTGEHSMTADAIRCPPTAAGGVQLLRDNVSQWRAVFDALTPQEYAQVGRCSFPEGLDPHVPLRDVLWWQNREVIHHGAEVSMLRDLYGWRGAR